MWLFLKISQVKGLYRVPDAETELRDLMDAFLKYAETNLRKEISPNKNILSVLRIAEPGLKGSTLGEFDGNFCSCAIALELLAVTGYNMSDSMEDVILCKQFLPWG